MGVTLHYYLVQNKKHVKPSLDSVQKMAEDIKAGPAKAIEVPVDVRRPSDTHLLIDIGNCETLEFNFGKLSDLPNFITERIGKPGGFPFDPVYMGDDDLVTWRFCKTQYADKLAEHRFVSDLLAHLAGKCSMACVSDEGDYYHSGRIEDAAEAIGETAKMIDSIGGMLSNAGWEKDTIIKGGETKIKPLRKNK